MPVVARDGTGRDAALPDCESDIAALLCPKIRPGKDTDRRLNWTLCRFGRTPRRNDTEIERSSWRKTTEAWCWRTVNWPGSSLLSPSSFRFPMKSRHTLWRLLCFQHLGSYPVWHWWSSTLRQAEWVPKGPLPLYCLPAAPFDTSFRSVWSRCHPGHCGSRHRCLCSILGAAASPKTAPPGDTGGRVVRSLGGSWWVAWWRNVWASISSCLPGYGSVLSTLGSCTFWLSETIRNPVNRWIQQQRYLTLLTFLPSTKNFLHLYPCPPVSLPVEHRVHVAWISTLFPLYHYWLVSLNLYPCPPVSLLVEHI